MVSNENSTSPENTVRINLASLSGIPFFAGTNTSKSGAFYFNLPDNTGMHDYFVSCQEESSDLKIKLTPEFCKEPFEVLPGSFSLSAEEKEMATEICINKQVNDKIVQHDLVKDYKFEDSLSTTFYGPADKRLYTNDFIDLPNIGDFIFELFGDLVIIKYNKQEPYIQLVDLNLHEKRPMLCLIDNVPIYDLSEFLKINTDKINYVEILARPYLVGNKIYKGIIFASSHNKDFAEVNLPKNAQFFRINSFSTSDESKTIYPPEFK